MQQTLKVKDRGEVPLHEVPLDTLQWYADKCKSRDKQEMAQGELARRNGGAQTAKPRQQSPAPAAITRAASTQLVEGSFGDPKRVTEALAKAAEQYHLVSPASVCGTLPEGCEVCLSLVHISPSDTGLYKVAGKLGLDRVMLSQIAAAAGATVVSSRRLDDGSHPHYCAWECVVAYRLFDGQLVHRTGNVEIDVRAPDGAAYVDIVSKNESPDKQLLELRKFLTRHAESKALNRAIAAMGIRRSYTKEELSKPFAVARLMFTGRSEDPATRAQFNAAIAQSFLGGTQQFYGGSPVPAPALPAAQYQAYAPPPTGQSRYAEPIEADGDEVPPSEPRPAEPAPAQQQAAPAQAPATQAAPAPAQAQLIGDGYDARGNDPNKY